jgi:hypothetical protein
MIRLYYISYQRITNVEITKIHKVLHVTYYLLTTYIIDDKIQNILI